MSHKLISFLIFFYGTVIASGENFEIKLDREYYNPFAISQAWLLTYPDEISKNDCIRLSFSIYDNIKNKELMSWETHLYRGKQKGKFFFFLTDTHTDSPGVRLDVIPTNNTSSACTFMNSSLPSVRFASTEKIETSPNVKNLLLHICPVPVGPQFRNVVTSDYVFHNFPAGQSPAAQINFDFNVYLTLAIVEPPKIVPVAPKYNIEIEIKGMDNDKRKEYLLKRKEEIEKEFSQGKASITDLKNVQKELNKILAEEKLSEIK